MQVRPTQYRNAFTLVELIVVISIVAVLFSVALMAILNIRSAGRRLECNNNLRQIGLATIQLSDAKRVYPYYKSNLDPGLVSLLPYVGETALHQQFANAATSHQKIAIASPVIFTCPDETEPIVDHVSYLPCGGETSHTTSAKKIGFYNRECRDSAFVKDGLSNTIFFSEKIGIGWKGVVDFEEGIKRYPLGVHEFVDSAEMFDQACRSCAESRDISRILPMSPLPTFTSQYCFGTRYTPNAPSCTFASSSLYPPNNQEVAELPTYTVSSFHSNSVNVALGDGSIKSISNDVDPSIWKAAGTVSGQDVVHDW